MLELADIRDVLAKSLGTTTPINMTRATVEGLRRLVRPEDVAQLRGKTIAEVIPIPARRLGHERKRRWPKASRGRSQRRPGSGSSQTPESTAETAASEESAE